MAVQEINNMAVFCDFENIALGVADAKYDKFSVKTVLEKLLVKGKGDMQTYLLSQRDGDISVPDGCTHTLRSPPVQFSKKIPVQRERGAGQGRRDESSSPVYWATR